MGARRRDELSDHFRAHFGPDADHLYAVLLAEMADDWDVGGVTREVFEGWEDAPAQAFPQLRMLAGLFRIVLRGEEPQLRGFYPCLGGDLDPEDAWAAVRPVLAAHVDELHESLTRTPQTNEPARTVALLVGLSEAVRRTGLRRVRLLEPGASAGLGLLLDGYRFEGDGWAHGPGDSPFVVAGCGAAGLVPERFEVVERRGCDLSPVDVVDPRGRAVPHVVRLAVAARPPRPARRGAAGGGRRAADGRPGLRRRLGGRAAHGAAGPRGAHRRLALGDPHVLAHRGDPCGRGRRRRRPQPDAARARRDGAPVGARRLPSPR